MLYEVITVCFGKCTECQQAFGGLITNGDFYDGNTDWSYYAIDPVVINFDYTNEVFPASVSSSGTNAS